jgi:hypothetical protein
VAVVLQPEASGAFPGGTAAGHAFAAASRTQVTAVDGAYSFESLPAGVYRLYASRLGYRPYSVVVELRSSGAAPVSIALRADPIPLPPVRPSGHARGAYAATDALEADAEGARLRAADQRRRQHLTTDARELTHADVIEAVTLGEPDVLRALQRLPGVSTRSDYTAELWTRGAPWSHTRVYFDGVPLYNPLHALGVVSGVGSNALGAVWFHPGVRSAAIAEGVAGVVDLQSRRASGSGELNMSADLSLIGAGLALDQRVHDGRTGWMVSGRRTYMDWFTHVARRASGNDDVAFPYGYSEVAGRVDSWLSSRTALDASWLWERDHLTSLRSDARDRLRSEWGNAAARVSITSRVGGLQVRHTAAWSDHDAQVGTDIYAARQVPQIAQPLQSSVTGVEYVALTGAVWPEPATLAGPGWSAGYALERQRARYDGPQVLPVPRAGFVTETAQDTLRVGWSAELPLAALWVERTFASHETLALRAGLRAEVGDAPANAGPLRLAPRASVRYAAAPELALSAGYARVYQYAQAVAPGGVHVASLSSTDVWLLAGPHVPAVRSDIMTAGLETWLGPARTVTLNVFVRRATGVATSDPRPGYVYARPSFVTGRNTARGLELGVRQITGPVTGSASYTLSRSDVTASGMTFAAAADRRHVLSTTALLRATSSLRTGFAFTAASGVPFTRTISSADECAAEPGCDASRLPWMSTPHAVRAPAYASLDLLVDWSRSVRGIDVAVYAQLRNALGRENATIYTGDGPGCAVGGCSGDLSSQYERGVPRLPTVGVRVRR